MTEKKISSHNILKNLERIGISILIIFGIFACTLKGNAQTTSGIPFNNIVSWRNNASIYYHFGGNSFVGMMFLSWSTIYSSWENIYLSGNSTPISCKSRLNGMYYNNMRWRRLWPLDTGNLQILTGQDSNYSSMTVAWGLFTDCSGTNINSNDIYGQITHTWWGITYTITAGLTYNFTGNSINTSSTLSGTLVVSWGTIQWYLYDTYGWIGEVGQTTVNGTTVGVSNGTITSTCTDFQTTRSSGTNITLTCTWSNVSQYILNLFSDTSWTPLIAQSFGWAGTSYNWNPSWLSTGNYVATCTTMIGSSSCNQLSITISDGWVISISTGTNSSWTSVYSSYTGARFVSSITTIRSAKLNKLYTSEDFSVEWLAWSTLATLSDWYLYINGTGVGQTGYVQNWDILNIDLISSEEYNTSVTAELSIADITGTFTIITMDPDNEICLLTNSQKAQIKDLFNSIKSGYANNEAKRSKMVYTMRSMIQDIQDFDYSCSLQYMQDLSDEEIDGNDETHVAPNCKEYNISYSKSKWWYTSSDFKKTQYFASLSAIKRFIDAQNPGDCNINTYSESETYDNEDEAKHIAPNGKIYAIDEGSGYYYSSTMLKRKNFDNVEDLFRYIDVNNPEIPIWDHEVDTEFDPVTYAAPNNKEYKIYHTDRWYMSYRLIKIKYFNTLEEIQNYIYQNNLK